MLEFCVDICSICGCMLWIFLYNCVNYYTCWSMIDDESGSE